MHCSRCGDRVSHVSRSLSFKKHKKRCKGTLVSLFDEGQAAAMAAKGLTSVDDLTNLTHLDDFTSASDTLLYLSRKRHLLRHLLTKSPGLCPYCRTEVYGPDAMKALIAHFTECRENPDRDGLTHVRIANRRQRRRHNASINSGDLAIDRELLSKYMIRTGLIPSEELNKLMYWLSINRRIIGWDTEGPDKWLFALSIVDKATMQTLLDVIVDWGLTYDEMIAAAPTRVPTLHLGQKDKVEELIRKFYGAN